jgi:Ca-activated chloride channel family protein
MARLIYTSLRLDLSMKSLRLIQVALLTSLAVAQDAQENVPLFRSEVALVKVDVSVAGRGGASIGGLDRNDFRVFDEGQPQPVVAFDRESNPLALVLLLDVSGSMAPSLTELAKSSQAALSRLHPGDRVALVLFASKAQVVEPFTTDFKAIQTGVLNSVYKQTLGRGTLINEGLFSAVEQLRAVPAGTRRAIVIVTDNESQRVDVQDAQVTRALQDANAVLSAIIVGQSAGPAAPSRYSDPNSGAPDVRNYVRNTGGDLADVGDVGDLFKKLVGTIRTRYMLQYAAPSSEAGTFHRIRVELSPEAHKQYPAAILQFREGYYAGAGK